MRVLVTGGAGFIGSHVVGQLVALDHEVLVIDRLHPAAHDVVPSRLPDGVEHRWEDLCDPAVADQAVAGVDAVCHQAAMVGLGVDLGDIEQYVRDNDVGTASLLGALHRRDFAGRLVLASSMVVYGEGRYRCARHGVVRPGPRPVDRLEAGRYEPTCPDCDQELEGDLVPEDAPLDPRNVYAATKLHQEHLCAAYVREHLGATCTALRYHNVYGPRMPAHTPYAGVASIFRSALERGESPRVLEDGGQRRDFVHVEDVARANVLALTVADALDGPCNVASGEPHTVLDMATAIADAYGGPAPEVVGGHRLGDVRHIVASPGLAFERLGFRAEVAFADGMVAFARAQLR